MKMGAKGCEEGSDPAGPLSLQATLAEAGSVLAAEVNEFADSEITRLGKQIKHLEAAAERAAGAAAHPALHNPADIEKCQAEEQTMRSHASVLLRRCAVLAGKELSYQDWLLGKWDGLDMQSALLAPGYVAPVITTNPSVSRGLGPNVGQGHSFNPSDLVQQQLAVLGVGALL